MRRPGGHGDGWFGKQCWQVQHYLMESAAGIIKNTVTIVQVLGTNQLHIFNILLSLVHFTFLFFLLLGQRTKRVKFSR